MDLQHSNLKDQYLDKPDAYYEMVRSEMLPFVPEDVLSVLEIGCSSGAFGSLVKENRHGCEIWGIEPSEYGASLAKERLDRVINGTLESSGSELEGQKFDCIVFNDVLEHLVNPQAALILAKNFLSPTGVVIASIPNILHFYQIMEILLNQDWKYEDSGIMDNTHLRFFTKKSILRLFESTGFEVTRIEGVNPSYGMKYRLANLLTLGRLSDWKFIQFAVQARLGSDSDHIYARHEKT